MPARVGRGTERADEPPFAVAELEVGRQQWVERAVRVAGASRWATPCADTTRPPGVSSLALTPCVFQAIADGISG